MSEWTVFALIFIPEEGDPLGMCQPDDFGGGPPVVFRCGCGQGSAAWYTMDEFASNRTHSCGQLERALVLAWDGVEVIDPFTRALLGDEYEVADAYDVESYYLNDNEEDLPGTLVALGPDRTLIRSHPRGFRADREIREALEDAQR